MNQKRALITGGTGFIGSRVVGRLVAEGWQAHLICRPGSKLNLLGPVSRKVVLHSWTGDFESLHKIVKHADPQVVIHLASLFLSSHEPSEIEPLFKANLLFGTFLAEAMTLQGVCRLVNTGTTWQHFGNSTYSPVNLYAASKQAFEDVLQYYVEARGLQVITLKLFDTYGPGDPRRKLLNLLLEAARNQSEIALSPGEQLMDLVHVDDVARAFSVAVDRITTETCSGHWRYCLSSGECISVKHLVQVLQQIKGVEIPVRLGNRRYRDREVMEPWRPCERLPGWAPLVSLEEGLASLNEIVAPRRCE